MPALVREISDAERRARLAVRHGLGPGCAFSSIASATAGMTAWHATGLPSVHLAIHARTRGLSVEDVDAALNQDRSLVKQLSMRRTLRRLGRGWRKVACCSGIRGPRAAGRVGSHNG